MLRADFAEAWKSQGIGARSCSPEAKSLLGGNHQKSCEVGESGLKNTG